MRQEKMQKGFTANWKNFSTFAKTNIIILTLVLVIGTYLIIVDPWNLSNEPYGAGDYYYTDVDGFDFLGSGIGTDHPIIFFSLFISWALCAWYFLQWVENKK